MPFLGKRLDFITPFFGKILGFMFNLTLQYSSYTFIARRLLLKPVVTKMSPRLALKRLIFDKLS